MFRVLHRTWRLVGLSLASLLLGSQSHAGTAGTLYSYSVSVGDATATANAVIFDGLHIWVAVEDQSGGWIKKLTLTGAVLSSTSVGIGPLQMAYDGARIWVSDYASSDITIVAQDGAVAKTIALPPKAAPEGILFDGKYMWVANNGVGANTVSKYNPGTMTLISHYTVGDDPDGLAFDGTYLWVTNSNSNNVMKLDWETGTILRTYPTGRFPLSIIFDGTYMWISNGLDADVGGFRTGSVTKVRAYGGITLGTIPVGGAVRGLAYDGTSIWVCNSMDDTFTRLRVSDGLRLGTYRTGAAPRSMAFDGVRVWIANSGANTITVVTPDSRPIVRRGGVRGSFTEIVPTPLAPMQTPVDSAFSGFVHKSPVTPAALANIESTLLNDN